MANRALRLYIRQIKAAAPAGFKKRLANDILPEAEGFIRENPGATAKEMAEAIGYPSELRAAFLKEIDPVQVKRRRLWYRLGIVGLSFFLAAVIAFGIQVSYLLRQTHSKTVQFNDAFCVLEDERFPEVDWDKLST